MSQPPGTDAAGRPGSPPATRALALVAAGLGVLIYLLGFFGEVSVTSSFGGPLLIAGGLLAGTAVLPQPGRVLAPAAVLTVTGTMLLVQLATGIGGPAVVIIALVLAFAQSATVVGALLLDSGMVTAPARRPAAAPYPPGYGYPPVPGPPGRGAGYRPPGALGPADPASGPGPAGYGPDPQYPTPNTGVPNPAYPGPAAAADPPPRPDPAGGGEPAWSAEGSAADRTTVLPTVDHGAATGPIDPVPPSAPSSGTGPRSADPPGADSDPSRADPPGSAEPGSNADATPRRKHRAPPDARADREPPA
jgi:Family of unknown function (DUF5336)